MSTLRQRIDDEIAEREQLRREGKLKRPGVLSRAFGTAWVLALVVLVVAVALGVVAVFVWVVILSAGAIAKALFAIAVVVVASVVWAQLRG